MICFELILLQLKNFIFFLYLLENSFKFEDEFFEIWAYRAEKNEYFLSTQAISNQIKWVPLLVTDDATCVTRYAVYLEANYFLNSRRQLARNNSSFRQYYLLKVVAKYRLEKSRKYAFLLMYSKLLPYYALIPQINFQIETDSLKDTKHTILFK